MSEQNGSPVGTVADVKGNATVIHPDQTREVLAKGAPVYQGDVIETDESGAVNITFNDNTVFAVSDNAKMTIDEFVYDPNKDGEGQADISVMRGVFVYTSGFVGKEDHNDVHIKTPVGSIGIRGTTLTGYLPEEGSTDSPRISLIEGAIVVQPNQGPEIFLDESRETVELTTLGTNAVNIGVIPAEQMIETFNVLRTVAPALFAPVTDALGDSSSPTTTEQNNPSPENSPTEQEQPTQETKPADDTTATMTSGEETQQTLEAQPVMEENKELITTTELSLLDSPLSLTMESTILMEPLSSFTTFETTTQLMPPPLLPPPPPPSGTNLLAPTGSDTVFYAPVNHAPVATAASFFSLEQAGLEGGTQSMDSTRFFRDIDGNLLTYNITGILDPNNVLLGASFNAAHQLTFTVKNGISGDSNVHIFVSATDGFLTSSSVDFTFQIYDSNIPGGATLDNAANTVNLSVGNNYRFSTFAGDDTVNLTTSANNVVFGDTGNDTITINSNGNSAFGEAGNDTLQILAGGGNTISGGAQNDTLIINSAGTGNNAFGGDGNDTVILDTNGMTRIQANGLVVDAGSGFDKLVLSSGGGFDLSLVLPNNLHSIEKIESSAGTNNINLDIKDIIEHTDGGYLFLSNANQVNVTNNNGLAALSLVGSSVSNPYDTTDGTTYAVYSNGAQTLYIDQSIATVTGV